MKTREQKFKEMWTDISLVMTQLVTIHKKIHEIQMDMYNFKPEGIDFPNIKEITTRGDTPIYGEEGLIISQ